jgi:hypothetical protein
VKRILAIAAAIASSGLMWGGAVTATAATSTAMVPGGAPMVRAAASGPGVPTISENWSGYAATSTKKFTYVHSEFVQPAVKCPGVKDQFTSNWVGLDGFADNTVEQDGTFAFCGGPTSTTPEYVAWYEMFPAGSVEVFPVKPGDVIDASVDYTAGSLCSPSRTSRPARRPPIRPPVPAASEPPPSGSSSGRLVATPTSPSASCLRWQTSAPRRWAKTSPRHGRRSRAAGISAFYQLPHLHGQPAERKGSSPWTHPVRWTTRPTASR